MSHLERWPPGPFQQFPLWAQAVTFLASVLFSGDFVPPALSGTNFHLLLLLYFCFFWFCMQRSKPGEVETVFAWPGSHPTKEQEEELPLLEKNILQVTLLLDWGAGHPRWCSVTEGFKAEYA